MNAWLREHLICPRDREQVDLSGHELVCPRGHRYPYVDGVPIMLLSELQPTHAAHSQTLEQLKPVFPILGVFRLNVQPKRDGSTIVRFCKASQSPVYPIRDTILAANHDSCPSLSSSGPRQWGESALKTSRLPGAISLLARSWLYPPSAWRRR